MDAVVSADADERLLRTTSESADRSHADTCIAVAEQASDEAGPARLVLVRSSHAAARLQRYCFVPVVFTRRLSNEVSAFAQD